jgi:hypothetical protein
VLIHHLISFFYYHSSVLLSLSVEDVAVYSSLCVLDLGVALYERVKLLGSPYPVSARWWHVLALEVPKLQMLLPCVAPAALAAFELWNPGAFAVMRDRHIYLLLQLLKR